MFVQIVFYKARTNHRVPDTEYDYINVIYEDGIEIYEDGIEPGNLQKTQKKQKDERLVFQKNS